MVPPARLYAVAVSRLLLASVLLLSVTACGPQPGRVAEPEPPQESGEVTLERFRAALGATEQAARAMHAHDPGQFEQQLAAATALMTPTFAERFTRSQRDRQQLFAELPGPVELRNIDGLGLIAGNRDEAAVLLTGRVFKHGEGARDEAPLNTVEVFHLVYRDARWLVDEVEMETGIGGGTARLDPASPFGEAGAVVEEVVSLIVDQDGADDADGVRLDDLMDDAETASTWKRVDTQLDVDGDTVATAVEEFDDESALVLAYIEGDRPDGRRGPLGVWRCSLVRSGDAWKVSDIQLAAP